ncbi:hypothetical protein D3C80_1769430 [compost metagenome]
MQVDLLSKLTNSSLEFSAMVKKVLKTQPFMAAINKCSGDQIPSMPFGKSGGVATSILCGKTGELKTPFCLPVHLRFTSYVCIFY